MSDNQVTRCICHDKSFEEIKKYAEENNISSLDELQSQNFCSNSCRMCSPYVEIVLESGQTDFYPGEPYRKNKE
jgi:bacterioferritin-associated ferredoxin